MLPPDSWYYKLLFDVYFLISFNLFSLAAIIHKVLFIVMILSYACMLNELILFIYRQRYLSIDHPILKCDGVYEQSYVEVYSCLCCSLMGKFVFSLLLSRYLDITTSDTLLMFSLYCAQLVHPHFGPLPVNSLNGLYVTVWQQYPTFFSNLYIMIGIWQRQLL